MAQFAPAVSPAGQSFTFLRISIAPDYLHAESGRRIALLWQIFAIDGRNWIPESDQLSENGHHSTMNALAPPWAHVPI